MRTWRAITMKIKGGYQGKILNLELTQGEVSLFRQDEDFNLKYVGGRGFGVKLVFDNLRKHKKIDPLGPENLVVIAPGPLSGLYLPSSGKTSFVSISPATGIYGDSNMGGTFGVELRQAGYDAVAIRGAAKNLSYIFIDDDEVRIIPNENLHTKGCLEVEGIIKKEIGDDHIKVAAIGPAGENLVRFACVNSDWSRNAGRTGIGAILGSKNIKAIAVRGSKDLPVYDLPRLREVSQRSFRTLRKHKSFDFWQQQGLMSVIDYVNEAGIIPTHNFNDAHFEYAGRINGYTMEDKYKIGDTACFSCPMCCGNVCLVKEGAYRGTVTEGPEYETAAMFGSNLAVDNFACILRANQLCDELGLDTISTGNLIGVMIEAVHSGLLGPEEVDGMPLEWGREDQIIELIEKIARREGIGDILANGSIALIERWPQLKPIISQVKGLEQSAYDARVAISMALGYATSDIGAHHTRAWTVAKELEMGRDWNLEKKAELVIYHQTVRPLFDMLGVCRLPWIELGFPEQTYAAYFNAVTGLNLSLDDLLDRSRSIYDMTRSINVALGISRKDDYPPDRVFDTPISTGPQAGKRLSRDEYESILDIYYQKRGWDSNGVPQVNPEAH